MNLQEELDLEYFNELEAIDIAVESGILPYLIDAHFGVDPRWNSVSFDLPKLKASTLDKTLKTLKPKKMTRKQHTQKAREINIYTYAIKNKSTKVKDTEASIKRKNLRKDKILEVQILKKLGYKVKEISKMFINLTSNQVKHIYYNII